MGQPSPDHPRGGVRAAIIGPSKSAADSPVPAGPGGRPTQRRSGQFAGHQATMEPVTRRLENNPCQDACGTVSTGELLDGAPIYRCPGCGSERVDIPATPDPDKKRSST